MSEHTVNQAILVQDIAEYHASYFVRSKGRLPATEREFVLWLREYDSELRRVIDGMQKAFNEFVSVMPTRPFGFNRTAHVCPEAGGCKSSECDNIGWRS